MQGPDYLVPPGQAHRALLLLFLLMAFDYIDRQVMSALLPLIKQDWMLSDTQLGALVSSVNVAIALLALPTALLVDRWSRSKSIGLMALIWSLASAAGAFSASYLTLLVSRFVVGAGEAGYSAGGNALLSALYPKRLRGTVIGIFQSAAMIGSVLGVVAGGYIGAHWGWRHAFGLVAIPGFFLAIAAFFVRDYKNVPVTVLDVQSGTIRAMHWWEVLVKIFRSPVLCLLFLGLASQLFFASMVGNWLPSFFSRVHALPLQQATVRSGVVLLMSAIGMAFCGFMVDRLARGRSHRRLVGAAIIAALCSLFFAMAFQLDNVALLFAGGLFMLGALAPVTSAMIDFVHPGMRTATSGAMITVSNLLGMTLGPLVGGFLSDMFSLQRALLIVSFVPLLAATCLALAAWLYERQRDSSAGDPGIELAMTAT